MTAFTLKAVITMYQRAPPDQPRTIPLTSTCHNTLIDPASAIYYNCDKEGYFTSSYLELKDIGDIKEIEEGEMSNKLGKEEPQGKTPPKGTLLILKRLI